MSINKPAFDKLYKDCCSIIETSNEKNIKSKMYKLHSAYLKMCKDEDAELQEFYSVVHELRLYRYMKSIGIDIVAQNDDKPGPDFITKLGYVECVSATKGQKGTPEREHLEKLLAGSMNRYLAGLPRLSSSIRDKSIKYQHYIDKDYISKNIPRIISLDTSLFSSSYHSQENIDLILKILYGIGSQTVTFNLKENKFIESNDSQTHQYDNVGIKYPKKN